MSLEIDEFKARIEASNSFEEVLDLLEKQKQDDEEGSGIRQATRKALELAATSEQVIDLWSATGSESLVLDSDILEKMIKLIETGKDLEKVYRVLSVDENELERRGLMRKLFDKADELGYPTT